MMDIEHLREAAATIANAKREPVIFYAPEKAMMRWLRKHSLREILKAAVCHGFEDVRLSLPVDESRASDERERAMQAAKMAAQVREQIERELAKLTPDELARTRLEQGWRMTTRTSST